MIKFYLSKFKKTVVILFAIFLSLNSNLFSQGAASIPHGFQVVQGVTPFVTTGGFNLIVPNAFIDEYDTLLAPPGFSFNYSGRTYTKFVMSTNGWIMLGDSSLNYPNIPPPLPNNQLDTDTFGYPFIAPLWDDLSTTVFTYVFYSNSLWVRWLSKWDKTNATPTTVLCWVQLNCTTSEISFYYANNTTYVPTSPSASIGINSWISSDFYSVNSTSNTTAFVDSLVENDSIGQGNVTTFRPYNCTYIWTPLSTTNVIEPGQNTLHAEVFPNPVESQITVRFKLDKSVNCTISIVDLTGAVVYSNSTDGVEGINVFNKNLDDIAAGSYYISVVENKAKKRFVGSFIKK